MVEPHAGSLLSCSTCSRLRCSFLGAITHCTSGQLGTTGNPVVSDFPPTRSIATFCTLSSLVKESRASLTRGWAEVRRGKDSDFENPVNALHRLTWKNPCESAFAALDPLSPQVMSRSPCPLGACGIRIWGGSGLSTALIHNPCDPGGSCERIPKQIPTCHHSTADSEKGAP
jgi:hypothetical protein